MESIFEFLFKFSPVVFEKGELAFSAAWPVYLILAVLIAAAGASLWTYVRARADVSARTRALLVTLRVAALCVVALCLLRPTLLVSTSVPQQNFLAVLIDDSRSMQLPGSDGRPRGALVQQTFAPESPLMRELSARYTLRFFRFSGGAERVAGAADVQFTGAQTQVGRALEHVRREMSGVPLAGVVVLTDGADNSQLPITESLLGLKSAAVPVFTVGIGAEKFARDVQVSRVQAPRTALRGSTLVVDVTISQRGYAGTRIPLYVEDGGRIVAQQEVDLPPDGSAAAVRVRFPVTEAGVRSLRFRVPTMPDEEVTQNNAQETLLTVSNAREKILYFEGEPRFEVKFLRRAVRDDPNLQLVVLQRTAEGKFFRMDVDSGNELVSGFPLTREQLFQYRGLIIGSVEASFFSHGQLEMIADFAGKRGGGVLLLGGRRAFAEGGYAGTPLEAAMPVVLPQNGATPQLQELRVLPTRIGATHPATQLGDDEAASLERWRKLPELTTVNAIAGLKPGATSLLTGTVENGRAEQIVLASQRFGRGKVIAFPVQDSWLWQMHYDVPLEDMTHETLWRQLLRWLVSDVGAPVVARASNEAPLPGEPVTLIADVDDSVFTKVNDARVIAQVTTPGGERVETALDWTVSRDGEYRATFTPSEPGMYEVNIKAERAGSELGSGVTFVNASTSEREYYDAEMRPALLQRIARETGGKYYAASNLRSLPEDIQYSGGGSTIREAMDLWDMPILFLLLILLLAAEWGVRRWKGFA